MVPAMIPPHPPAPVSEPADPTFSAGSAGRIFAGGAPVPSTAATPFGGTIWTEEV